MIRPATFEDIPAILRIFDIARSFMRENGNPTQWIGYPAEEHVRADIAKGACYVLDDQGVHAVFSLFSDPDPTYKYIEDGAWPNEAPYGTIHRIASDGTRRGVVRQAVDFALQFHSVLRCDTHKDNLPMQRALIGAGFVRCGIIYLENGDPREAFWRGETC
ncbi:MAG: N-acetyltransferase [Clostridia bacterium]|nr:N-acetyltransferase [Clostridia bacterium]